MKAELKPCPFCYSDAQISASDGLFFCECSSDDCTAETICVGTEAIAMRKWEARELYPPMTEMEICETAEKKTARTADNETVRERIADLRGQIAGLESLAEIWEQELHRRR